MRVNEDKVHVLAGKEKLKDKYKDPNMLSTINKSDMAGMMEAIKEYLRSHCIVMRAPLAYIIRKTIQVQTYDEYLMYATPDNKMITRMLHLPPDKTKILLDSYIQSTKAHMVEYKIDNRSVYDILDQICKDTNLYPYVKHIMPSIPGGWAQIISM